jgi:hypothetical protein
VTEGEEPGHLKSRIGQFHSVMVSFPLLWCVHSCSLTPSLSLPITHPHFLVLFYFTPLFLILCFAQNLTALLDIGEKSYSQDQPLLKPGLPSRPNWINYAQTSFQHTLKRKKTK